MPAWSPDEQRLAVAKIAGDDVGLYTLAADGSDLQLITTIFKQVMASLGIYLQWFGAHPRVVAGWDADTLLLFENAAACIIDLASGEVTVLIER